MMKNKIFNNFGLKILAVMFAFVLWLVVMNISDYSITIHVDKIPVTQLNGDALEELDKIYDVTKGDTVDIIVKGRRSIVDELTPSDFIATADLSAMSITNTVQIAVKPKDESIADEISITIVDNTMQLSLEEKISVQLPVTFNVSGVPEEGYAVGEITSNPNIITIEGPKNTVKSITEAVVAIDVDGRDVGFSGEYAVKLYDAYGSEVKNSKLQISRENVYVNAKVCPKKTVRVEVETIGEVAEGYIAGDIMYQPQTITIAGDREKINEISKIVVNDISIDGLAKEYQATINLKNYLPEDVFIAQDSDDVVVTVPIEKISDKKIKPTKDNITLTGKNNLYNYEIIMSDDFEITVVGIKGKLDEINATTLGLKVKCQEMSKGIYYNTEVTMNKEEGVEYKIQGHVSVRVTDK